jgi:cyclophilin family peptidyl-prolyl cis-trans isomerase
MKSTRILSMLIVILLVIAGIHWYTNSRPDAYFNQYGVTTTPSPVIPKLEVTAPVSQDPSVTAPINNTTIKNNMHNVTIETNKGTIVIETYDADAPKTVNNFVTLAGKGFYNGLIFHRVIKNFMIQGGDPTGTGAGGPGYKFEDELNPVTPSYKAGYTRGVVAMANSGPNTNGSQFFIMHKDYALPHNYSIFGKVISGMEVVDAIATTQTGPNDKPVQDVVMKKVTAVKK